MTEKVKKFFDKREWAVILLFTLVFVIFRLPGTSLPLHQDEYKWPLGVNPVNQSGVSIPHPPIGEFIYRTAGFIVGFNTHFRFVPLLFGTLNLLLLYYLMRFLFGRKEATIASLIWIFSYFSVLASLMVDTDGQILPFFFLLALIGYYKSTVSNKNRLAWLTLLIFASVLGFLVKVSFLLAIGAIAVDYLWSKKDTFNKKIVLTYLGYGLVGAVGLIVLLFLASYVFPFFNFGASLKYWEHFAALNRDWFQTLIQCLKAILYTSPFLVFVPFLGSKKDFSRLKVFLFFLLFAFIFYIVLFDFSLGALDRYLQLLILPLTVLSSAVIAKVLQQKDKRTKEFVLLGTLCGLILILLAAFPHYVPPLHPKTEWISRVLSLRWNFLYPFSGGSGPLGFYVSFLFMALAWIVSGITFLFGRIKTRHLVLALAFLVPVGIAYNGMFIEEYLIGHFNGYAPGLLAQAVEFIQENSDIHMVTVYNDNGGNEIRDIEKYRKRLYIDPKFDQNEKIATLNQYKEHYFVLDVPRINPASVYQKYFDSCKVVYRDIDKQISATIYDCRNVPDLVNQ